MEESPRIGILAAQIAEQDRAQVGELAKATARNHLREIEYVDQGYTGEQPAPDVAQPGVRFVVVKHPRSQKSMCVLHPEKRNSCVAFA